MIFFAGLIILFASFGQALISTVVSLILALSLAHCLYRFDFLGKYLLLACAVVWFIMPTKLVAIIVADCFGVHGIAGIVFAHVLLNMPFATYLMYLSYQKIDCGMLWVAQQLGATSWRCYADIVFPLLKPTIISTSLLIFLLCFSSFSIPLIISSSYYYQTPEVMLYQSYHTYSCSCHGGDNSSALWALVPVMSWFLSRLLVIVPLGFLYQQKQRAKCASVLITHVAHESHAIRYNLRKHGIYWLTYLIGMSCFMFVPLIVLLIHAINTGAVSFLLHNFLGDADMNCAMSLGFSLYRVVGMSLLLALVSSFGALCIGFIVCRLGMQGGARMRMVGSGMSLVPFMLGAVGCGVLFAFLSHSTVLVSYGSYAPFILAALCHIVLNYPFVYRVLAAQLCLYNQEWRFSAHSLGASKLQIMRTIEIPFIRPALLKAFCIAFGLSLTEVGAATVLQEKIGVTLPLAIRMYREQGANDAVMGLSVLLLGITFLLSFSMVPRVKSVRRA